MERTTGSADRGAWQSGRQLRHANLRKHWVRGSGQRNELKVHLGVSHVWVVFKAVSLEEACLGPRVDTELLGPGTRSVRGGEKRKPQQWGLTGPECHRL